MRYTVNRVVRWLKQLKEAGAGPCNLQGIISSGMTYYASCGVEACRKIAPERLKEQKKPR